MKKDSLYVQDSLSSQIDNEDKIRKQKKNGFYWAAEKRLFRIFANEG